MSSERWLIVGVPSVVAVLVQLLFVLAMQGGWSTLSPTVTVKPAVIQASLGSFETVTDDPDYRGYAGNMHYVQYLVRDHPLNMRPGQQYKLVLSYQPDVAFADE